MVNSLLLVAILLSATATCFAHFNDEFSNLPLSDAVEDAILLALDPSPKTTNFAHFAQKYKKTYNSLDEIRRRFEIFNYHLDLIEANNKKNLSYSLGINEFADLTWEEFNATWLGSKINEYCHLKGNHVWTNKKLPRKKDWRKDGIVGSVKQQGICSSCWAFSATGAIEAAYTQITKKSITLSAQQLLECATDNNGCLGGYHTIAYNYIKQSGGIETEKSYPYLAKDGKCRFNQKNVAAKVADIINITMGSENEMKDAVGIVGPVSIGFEAINIFRFYTKGIYTSNRCKNSAEYLNHAALAIGYGVENGKPYWLIKNSWGKGWGENGYFKLVFGKNMCGVASCSCYPIVTP